MGRVLSVYRNLPENYEFKRRCDEDGKFLLKLKVKVNCHKSLFINIIIVLCCMILKISDFDMKIFNR